MNRLVSYKQKFNKYKNKIVSIYLSNVISTPCWVVKTYCIDNEYVWTKVDGIPTSLHEISLSIKLARLLQPGMQVDHTCYVKACVNPNHLEEVTRSENQLRREFTYANLKTGNKPYRTDYVKIDLDIKQGKKPVFISH